MHEQIAMLQQRVFQASQQHNLQAMEDAARWRGLAVQWRQIAQQQQAVLMQLASQTPGESQLPRQDSTARAEDWLRQRRVSESSVEVSPPQMEEVRV